MSLVVLLFAFLSAENNIYTSEVVRHIDGDTIVVRIPVWPDFLVTTSIRQRDIDTPELRSRCKKERDLAIKAKQFAEELLPVGAFVDLMKLKPDRFGRRYDAFIMTPDGKSYALLLVEAGLARPYDGGKRMGWC